MIGRSRVSYIAAALAAGFDPAYLMAALHPAPQPRPEPASPPQRDVAPVHGARSAPPSIRRTPLDAPLTVAGLQAVNAARAKRARKAARALEQAGKAHR